MILVTIILIIIAVGTIKTLSFAAWSFREKNYVGGVAMIVLSLLAAASSYVIL